MYFTNKRQQFLIDQGYSYKVLANILEQAGEWWPGAAAEQSTLALVYCGKRDGGYGVQQWAG
jgi:hypothetical protein